MADVMTETGHDALDVICDLLLAEDLGVSQVTSGPWAETLPLFVAHPVGMVGTDSTFLGAKPSPRTYGSFPRILGQFVRDEALLSLEEAIRKMTSAPAARLGLRDRGRHPRRRRRRPRGVRSGHGPLDRDVRRAAVVPDRASSTSSSPATLVVADGVHTGATPGRASATAATDAPRATASGRRGRPLEAVRRWRTCELDVGREPRCSAQLGVHPLLGLDDCVAQLDIRRGLAQPIASRRAIAPDSSHSSQASRTRSM